MSEVEGIIFKPISNGLKNDKVECVSLERPKVTEGMFPLHTLAAFIGARGSGKTNAAIQLTRRYFKDKSFNRLFIISPTYKSNPEMHTMKAKMDDVYMDATRSLQALASILSKIKDMADEYKDDQDYQKVYERYKSRRFTLSDQIIMDMNDHRKPKYMPKPSCLLFIDDMMKTPIYATGIDNPFNNLCTLHRHVHEVGLSIFMLVQNYTQGVPGFIRQNLQQFFIFKTSDMKMVESMFLEFGNVCTYETFVEIFHDATNEPNHFLTVDPFNKNPDERFRQDFDKFIIIPPDWSDVTLSLRNKRKRILDKATSLGTRKAKKQDESNTGSNGLQRGSSDVAK